VPDAAALDLGNGPLSYECSYKRTASANGILMYKGTQAPALFMGSDGSLAFQSYAWSGAVESSVFITDTTWHHVVGTKDASNNWKIYVEGVDRTTVVASPTTVNTATDMRFGTDGTYFANRSLDEVAVYSVALSAATVLAHYNAGPGAGGTIFTLAVSGSLTSTASVARPEVS